MMKPTHVIVAVAAVATAFVVQTATVRAEMSPAEEEERMSLAGGAWHPGKFVPCAEGVVTNVQPRLDEGNVPAAERFASGVSVEMRIPTAPKFLNGQPFPFARVVHYDRDLGNAVMEAEHPGDRVQVCLFSFPTPSYDLSSGKIVCDPNEDPRGMMFRVYDYKRHAAYLGPTTEHGCGGA